MPWVRFDDGFTEHGKIRDLSDAAFRLHVSAIFWCNAHLTDGRIRDKDLRNVSNVHAPNRHAAALVDAGLWKPTENGWVIHDYLEYQYSAERIRADRKAAAERQRKWKEKRKGRGNAVTNAVSNGYPDTVPDPEGVGSGRGRQVHPPKRARPRAVPDWCGDCDENTRLTEVDLEPGCVVVRCPACHPLNSLDTA